jgi:hypothetical protein
VGGAYNEFMEVINSINLTSVSNEQLLDKIYDIRYNHFTYNRYKKGLSTSERETLRPLLSVPGIGNTI